MTRTLTRISSEPPTMRNAPSSSTRSRSPCPFGDRSPISSRNSVPPSASWKRPGLVAMAPVKAPLTWPNSSASSNCSASAAQFTEMKGRSRRALCAWMERATISLPVPLSPSISTVTSLLATSSMSRATARMASHSPTSRPVSVRVCRRSRSSLFSATTAWNSSAFCTSARSRFMSIGLGR